MSGLKTLFSAARKTGSVAALMIMSLFASPQSAEAIDGLGREFAYCTGRLSAQLEHEWLLSDPAADRTAMHRNTMISLMESVVPPAQARRAMELRISAKLAHSTLLTQAFFSQDTRRAASARARADAEIGTCLTMLLS